MAVCVWVCMCVYALFWCVNICIFMCMNAGIYMQRNVCRATSEDGFQHDSLPDTLKQESLVLWGLLLQATLGACRIYPSLLSSNWGTLQFQILCDSYGGPQGLSFRVSGLYSKDLATSQCCSLVLMTFYNQIIFNLSAVLYQHMYFGWTISSTFKIDGSLLSK